MGATLSAAGFKRNGSRWDLTTPKGAALGGAPPPTLLAPSGQTSSQVAAAAKAQLAAAQISAATLTAGVATGGGKFPPMAKGISPHPNCLTEHGKTAVALVHSFSGNWKTIKLPAGKLEHINDCAAVYNALGMLALGVDKEGVHPDTLPCPFLCLGGACHGQRVKDAKPGDPKGPCPKCVRIQSWERAKLKPLVGLVKAAADADTKGKLKGDG